MEEGGGAESKGRRSVKLNPRAKEFYPKYYPFYPPTTTNTTTTFFRQPPPPLQMPHEHFQRMNNYQFYPSTTHHHHLVTTMTSSSHYSNNFIGHHHHYQITPPPQMGLAHPTQFRPGPQTRPKFWRRVIREHEEAAATASNKPSSNSGNSSSSGSGGNKEGKQGLISVSETPEVDVGGGERRSPAMMMMMKKKLQPVIVTPNGSHTTAMIRNIPNQYTRAMLMEFLDEFCASENQKRLVKARDGGESQSTDHPSVAFDFLYLPTDFKSKANKGYAFVNFTHPSAVWKLRVACGNRPWKHCNSSKLCQITYGTIQGKHNLEDHFGRSRFICDLDEYLPISFDPPRDGSKNKAEGKTIGQRIDPFVLNSVPNTEASLALPIKLSGEIMEQQVPDEIALI